MGDFNRQNLKLLFAMYLFSYATEGFIALRQYILEDKTCLYRYWLLRYPQEYAPDGTATAHSSEYRSM